MKYDTKALAKRAFLLYTAVNLFTYLFTHVAYLFMNDVAGEILEYVSYYLTKITEFIAPPTIAAVALIILISYGKRSALVFTLATASARIFYALPYYYLIFIYNYGHDSLESIVLSLAASALVILVTVIGVIIFIAIYYLVLTVISKRTGTDAKVLFTSLEQSPVTDFLAGGNIPVLTFALVQFSLSLIMEIIDTVAFLIEYRSDYLPKEIITILVNFILLFILLVASYTIAACVKNAVLKSKDHKEQDEI